MQHQCPEYCNHYIITQTVAHISSLYPADVQAGDSVLGYDLNNAVFNEMDMESWKNLQLPDVVVVKKK